MKTFNIDHKFSSRNDNESTIVKAIENAMGILVKELGIENMLTLRVERMNGWGQSDAFHAGKWIPSKKLVKINFRNLYGASLATIIEVLGHELRHAKQTIDGVLDEVEDTVYAPGSFQAINNAYFNAPREKDARKYQKLYANIVFESAEFQYADKLDLSEGVVWETEDKQATHALMGYTTEDVLQRFKSNDEVFVVSIKELNEALNKKAKKWTKSVCKLVWSNRELLNKIDNKVMRKVTIDDLVS